MWENYRTTAIKDGIPPLEAEQDKEAFYAGMNAMLFIQDMVKKRYANPDVHQSLMQGFINETRMELMKRRKKRRRNHG